MTARPPSHYYSTPAGLGWSPPLDQLIEHSKFPKPLDLRTFAATWATRTYSCGLFTDPSGREWNNIHHAINELVTDAEGCLKLVIGSRQYCARLDNEVFIPKGTFHSVKPVHHTITRWLYGYD